VGCGIHRAAERELSAVTAAAGDELTKRLRQLGEYEQPTNAPYVKQLSDDDSLWRVRIDGYRAICRLDKPMLQVLLIGTRKRVYDRLDVAADRAGL